MIIGKRYNKCRLLIDKNKKNFIVCIFLVPVGSGDYSPLSKHTFPVGGNASRPAGRQQHRGEAG